MQGQSETPSSGDTTRFGAFEVDFRRGELRKHGIRIKLQDQPFKILVALLENPGEVVSRDDLKALIWGGETFVDFQHGLNAAVNRLRDALGDSADSPRYVETVARRGYRFVAEVQRPVVAPEQPAAGGQSRQGRYWGAAAALLVVAVAVLAVWQWRRDTVALPALVQLTAQTGSETMPTISPDGGQVAFVWNGENERNADIYVKMTDGAQALRLTSDPGADLLPAWSPDGRQIAFVRIRGTTGIYLVSPQGGPERKLLELPGVDRRPGGPETRIVGDLLYPIASRPSWSADGRFLAFSRYSEPPEPGDGTVLLVPVDGGAPRPMLTPKPGNWYKQAEFSPDGRRMAVTSCRGVTGGIANCQVEVVSLTPELAPAGDSVTVLADCPSPRGTSWLPDGDSLVVSGCRLPHYYLWRVSASRLSAPQKIEMAGAEGLWPAVNVKAGRLAFGRSILQADLWRWSLGERPTPFLSSTARDTAPRLSPDGQRIAFQSARGGNNDIWVARADGTGAFQLTKRVSESNGSPEWSPDGRWIAFDGYSKPGRAEMWIVPAEGGIPRRLTDGTQTSAIPNWSRDGKTIYFHSDRSGRSQIWRMPAEGGEALQVTRAGGFVGRESADGKKLFYTKSDHGGEGLFSMPLGGGPEQHVISDHIVRRCFDVFSDGIYYIAPRNEELCEIRFHEFASGRERVVGEVERPVAFGMSVSPDRKTFVFSRPVTGSDLMWIENFR